MNFRRTRIPEIVVFEPRVWSDERGLFFESYNQMQFTEAIGRDVSFVQDNHSSSKKGVLRGLHYQLRRPQGKLVRIVHGEVFDVGVDLRQASPTFGQWVGETLSAENRKQMWIPEGFGHGFLVLSAIAEVIYKVTDYYCRELERTITWNDPQLNINWPFSPIKLSAKDIAAPLLQNAELFV
jgi:dTDP-4-dehydrorhamnose 3,5-epimerase